MTKGIILLAAGGTGGHLFPAEALAHELKGRGWSVHLVTDSRAERFAGRDSRRSFHEETARPLRDTGIGRGYCIIP